MRRVVCAFFVALIIASHQCTPVARAQQKPQTPTFRTAVALVPIDVRVMDKKTGKPVTDLKQEDFTILEDNVRQEIRHFLLQTFDDDASHQGAAQATPAPPLKPVMQTSPLSLTPQAARIFLIVLAHGRLQQPSKGLDALLSFVRTRLLPRDQVALFAYNRATDFTTDHEMIAKVVERYRQENDTLTAQIDFEMSGLAAIYGSQELSDSVQARIDRVFEGAGELPYTQTGSAESARGGERVKRDARKRVEDALDGVVAANRIGPASETDRGGGAGSPVQSWSSFDAFVAETGQTLRDVGNLYAAIAYMRQLEGEKHLIFMTPGVLSMPRVEDYTDIARVAADARVALDVIAGFGGALDNRLTRSLSDETGGAASIAEYAQPALERVDAATRTGYLLGYYPTNSKWDAGFRKVVVKVNRPNVTVLFRNGYHAFAAIPNFDKRGYITRFRIDSALRYPKEVKDIGVKLDASLTTENGQRKAVVNARIDPSHLYFNIRKGIHLGRIDIAVIAMDENRVVIGGTYKKMVGHLEYDKETFALVKKNGIPVQVKLAVPPNTRYVRLVIYDYVVDLVGTSSTWVF
jgi:VWFA-related protein